MSENLKKKIDPQIEESWKTVLEDQFNMEYFHKLKAFLTKERQSYVIYPPGPSIFAAFNHTPFSKVKIVVIGQDPYHGKGQAHGLCFSVKKGIKPPPSLVNIFKELNNDMGIPTPSHGELTSWAKQGVLLLNTVLTVRASRAGSHKGKGWEIFTDKVIERISENKKGVVFLLWGSFAKEKEKLIDTSQHYILKSTHPSPFSARYGFLGCKHFSMANEILRKQGIKEIDWRLE